MSAQPKMKTAQGLNTINNCYWLHFLTNTNHHYDTDILWIPKLYITKIQGSRDTHNFLLSCVQPIPYMNSCATQPFYLCVSQEGLVQ